MTRNKYHVERRQGSVYNAATGRLQPAHVVVYNNPTANGGPIRQIIPGTWTKKAAVAIAKDMNNPRF